MRAATLRRSMVFAVCALGVSALYLAPSIARSPDQVGSRRPSDEPTGTALTAPEGPSPTATGTRRAGAGTRESVSFPVDESTAEADSHADADPTASRRPVDLSPSRGATPFDPRTRGDEEPPQPVATIRPAKVTVDRLTLDWSKADDNVRVIGYRVWLNGFEVASTVETHATIRWFNDDTRQQVVQVKAVDEAGNHSPTSPSLLVTRPEPEPEPTPGPTEPTAEPEPTEPAEPSPSPTREPSAGPLAAPSPQASATVGPQ